MRLLALDIGRKRIGVAVSDPMQLIATPLQTIPASSLRSFIADYVSREPVEAFILGKPLQTDASPSESTQFVQMAINILKKNFPHIPIHLVDERYTSLIAENAIKQGGVKKKKLTRDKGMIDQVAATLILQTYMQTLNP